ncbi:MAG: hypothetical protein EAZ78_18765 [Oscillatoriales cyanobacterium]|uniref:hypothetical protein n=1 Tax=Microcoleus anatoxicus TaxID=2705319 RepID=UPI00297511EF|nr:MAG: hypothetical protein EAZ78_18765 [Oscillatoriales cyanobacterium]TAF37418.1 MAG: hypothetical protein EAZ68_14695 [Oscillatoriales cyanobacterium]
MGINEECDVLQSMLRQVIDSLAEAQSRSKYLPDCDIYELKREISDILEICCEEMSHLKVAQNQIELIQAMIGVQSFLPSIISPPTKLANTTVNDTSIQDAIAKSEIFLTTAIASGVPTWLALELANLPGDSWMLYENPNATERLTDLTQNPASDYYQKKPNRQLQGDQGELVLLKMLLDSDDTENLLSSLRIKPKLNFENGKDYCKPDFYLTSHRLICDAKAYKPSSINGIKAAAKKYVNYLQENGGGEVKFYVPRDTYAKCQHKLNRLQSQENGVNVTIHPMTIDYEHILWKKELIYTYLKSLLKFK